MLSYYSGDGYLCAHSAPCVWYILLLKFDFDFEN